MINTFSAFYYGHVVDETNQYLNFKEGAGPELSAVLNVGSYSPTDFVVEIARAMNTVGSQTYAVALDRTTRLITISALSSFDLLITTGTGVSKTVFTLAGFTGADTGLAVTHTANNQTGTLWSPQFKAQEFISFDDNQSAIDGVVKKSANGTIEVASFGNQKIMELNFLFITNIVQSNSCILKTDSAGVDNARSFLQYAVTKADLEFIPDIDVPDVFNKTILDATDKDSNGLGFRLKEMYSKGLPGYFETGLLKFRLLE